METKNLGLDDELFHHILDAYAHNYYAIHTGIKLKSLGPGTLTAELTVAKEICNLLGKMHGGAAASLADTCLGTCCGTLDALGITMDLNIHYMAPAGEHETIYASTKILRFGKKVLFPECTLENNEGVLIAKASGTFFNGGPVCTWREQSTLNL